MAKTPGVENRLAEIARIRARFLTLDRERDEAERAPLPRSECEQRIDQVLEGLAAQAKPELLGQLLISPSRKGSVAGAAGIVAMLGEPIGGVDHARATPAGVLLAAVAPDQLREWLLQTAADAAEAYPPALSASDRAGRLELLSDERRDLERDEASACWAIEDLGQQAAWRGDMDPVLVLGLEA